MMLPRAEPLPPRMSSLAIENVFTVQKKTQRQKHEQSLVSDLPLPDTDGNGGMIEVSQVRHEPFILDKGPLE